MNNERKEMNLNSSNGEMTPPEPTSEEKRDDFDHLWVDLGGEG